MKHSYIDTDTLDDFYVTIASDKCLDNYPLNNSVSFTNDLYRTLNLKDFEAALVELYLSQVEPTEVNEEHATILPEVEGVTDARLTTFFDNIGVDNIITGRQLTNSLIGKFAKKDTSLTNFFAALQRYLMSKSPNAKIELKTVYKLLGSGPYTQLTFIDPTNQYTLRIPVIWATVFGFKAHDFTHGDYTI